MCNALTGKGSEELSPLTPPNSTGGTLLHAPLAHRQDMHAGACQPNARGVCRFFGVSEKTTHKPHPTGEREGTWFPHTPTGEVPPTEPHPNQEGYEARRFCLVSSSCNAFCRMTEYVARAMPPPHAHPKFSDNQCYNSITIKVVRFIGNRSGSVQAYGS
jgi:hypothetical protein